MTQPREPSSLAPFLEEMSWLRRLAHGLVADPHAADDAVQETLAAAVEKHPDTTLPARGWLATVLRNALRQEHRSASRRSRRERAGARPEALPSASDLAGRVELQRRLAESVLALAEPTRSTIILRYFEGLPPRHIAKREGIPVATVKSRLQRGLADLRQDLDRDFGGDGRAWMLMLAPLLRSPLQTAPVLPLTIGVLAVNTKILLVCLAIAVALVFTFLYASGDAPSEFAPAIATEEPTDARSPVENPIERAPDARPTERASIPAAPQSGSDDSAPAEAAAALDGFAFDASGGALVGVRVRATDGEELVRTGGRGRFRFPKRPGGSIELAEPDYATVLWGSTSVTTRGSVVVAARAIDLGGRVVDEAGDPVEGAHLSFDLPHGFRGRFPVVADDSHDRAVAIVSEATGAFAFPALAAVEGATLQVSKNGYRPTAVAVPRASDPNLLVTLRRPDAAPVAVRGTVIDDTGLPVAGAIVGWGDRCAESAADGTFSFPSEHGERNTEETDPIDHQIRPATPTSPEEEAELTMVALRRGRLPGRVRASSVDGSGRALWPEPLVIRLGGPPLAIRGRVEDADGKPRPDVRVWANALTFFGWRPESGSGEREMTYVEIEVAGRKPGWNPQRTDERGEFVIEGLLPRSYHLTAIDDGTVARVDALEVPAGSSGVVLRFAKDALIPAVRGRVVDKDGAGIPDVNVRTSTDAYYQDHFGHRTGIWHDSGTTAETDAEGRFMLRDVPRERAYLRFDGENVLSASVHPEDVRWPPGDEEIVVTMVRRCHFQVELGDPTLADEFALLDRHGERITLTEFLGGGSYSSDRMKLQQGKSSTLVASDDAQMLVLFRKEAEVIRAPIRLVPGELTVLRP